MSAMSNGPVVNGVDLGMLNYTEQIPYNGTIRTGGNSLIQDLNVFYDVHGHPLEHKLHEQLADSTINSLVISPGCSRLPLSSCL